MRAHQDISYHLISVAWATLRVDSLWSCLEHPCASLQSYVSWGVAHILKPGKGSILILVLVFASFMDDYVLKNKNLWYESI